MKSLARRISDGRMLGLIKAWLEMPVEEDDGKGGKRRTNRARKERKGTPQGSPISPLLSNVYMRRFVLGWKTLGYAQHFCAEIVNFADDLCVLGKAPAAEMLTAVERLMGGLKLTVNEQKTRCLRCPEEPIEFLGYRIGRNYRPHGKGAYIGTRPGKASVQSICRKISEMTAPQHGWKSMEEMVEGPEPHHERVGKLLQPRPSQPGLQRGQPPHGKAATPVARSKAQDAGGEIRGDTPKRGCAQITASCVSRGKPWPFRARRHDLVRKPDAGNPHVRFDERGSGNETKETD